MFAYLAVGVEFDGRDRLAAEVLAYIRRTTRLNYRLEDLEEVVEFLGHFPAENKLTQSLVRRGLNAYPDSVALHLVAAGTKVDGPAGYSAGFGRSQPSARWH